MEYFYSYIDYNGEESEEDFGTQQEAQDVADEEFNELCSQDCETTNCSFDISIIKYCQDEDGERTIIETIKSSVDYEYYHGDYAEHSVWHSGAGGVL